MVKIKDNYFLKIINSFLGGLILALIKDYEKGSKFIYQQAGIKNKSDKPTKEQTKLLTGQIYDNIKEVTEEDSLKLKNVIRGGLLDGKSNAQIAELLDDVFKGKNPTKLRYEDRLKAISRTESARLYNHGSFKTAVKLGFKYKYLSGVSDNREGQDSKIANSKYGSPAKSIPINEPFKYTYKGKVREFMYGPDRTNDRSVVHYLYEKPTKK